jgi:magnesium chelatase subunit I
MTGKVELVFEGEQEGAIKVGKALIGRAVRETFRKYFPDPLQRVKTGRPSAGEPKHHADDSVYAQVTGWFEAGNHIEVSDEMPLDPYFSELNKVKGLRDLTVKHMRIPESNKYELASAMEFTLDGLHQFSRIAKDEMENTVSYKDMVGSILGGRGKGDLDD